MAKDTSGTSIGLAAGFAAAGLIAIGFVSALSELFDPTPPAPELVVAPAAGPVAAAPAAPVAAAATPAPEPGPAAATPAATPAQDEIQVAIQHWRDAWAKRDVATYLTFYAPDFKGNAPTPQKWQADRKRIIGQTKSIDIQIGFPEIRIDGEQATASFEFQYQSDRLQDKGTKLLQLQHIDGHWLIAQESFKAH